MSQKQELDINLRIILDQENASVKQLDSKQEEVIEKVKMSLSVAQLAYIVRMLSDLKVIKNKNISSVMRLVTNNISTPKAKDISVDSFKTKYYNTDTATKESVKDFVIKQLNYISKDLK
ncbi:MAG: hypothetical protein ACNS60_19790 [Candidatus Cyclobacteriaceae bacterium M2_1C_046]